MKKENNIIFWFLCFFGILLAEVYFLLEFRSDLLIVVGSGILLLLTGYMLLDQIKELLEKKEEEKKEENARLRELLESVVQGISAPQGAVDLKEIEKMQKANFVMLQKNAAISKSGFLQVVEKLETCNKEIVETLEASHEKLGQELQLEGRKALKVIVKYNRDDTRRLVAFQKKAFDNIITGMEQTVLEVTSVIGNMTQDNVVKQEDTKIDDSQVMLEEKMVPAEESLVEDTKQEWGLEESNIETTVTEEIKEEPKEKEQSDPNKMMSPEDIAALLASTEEIKEEPKEKEQSDPNKMMSPEDIAALLASTEEIKEEPKEKEQSDPNKMMSPEDIAALLASTEEIKEEPKEKEQSDPNKMMSPEDIAALLASMN